MEATGAIFDMDGTLLDSMEYWMNSGVLYLKSLGIEAEPNLKSILYYKSVKDGALYLNEHYGLKKTYTEIVQGIYEIIAEGYKYIFELKPGAKEILIMLKQKNVPIALATATDRKLFLPALKRLELTSYFDVILTCSECCSSKSSPEIYKIAAQKMNSPIETTLVFEDATFAVKTAFNAGFKTIALYDSTNKDEEETLRKNSTVYCKNLTEAILFVQKL